VFHDIGLCGQDSQGIHPITWGELVNFTRLTFAIPPAVLLSVREMSAAYVNARHFFYNEKGAPPPYSNPERARERILAAFGGNKRRS